MALTPSQGRDEWQGEPFTVTNTLMRPRLPSVILSPVPPSTAMSARMPAPSTTLLIASCLPVSPERQQAKMSLPLIAALLAITASMACNIAARFAFCSLAPLPIMHSPGRPYAAAVDDVAGVGVGHGRGGLVHGIADEHQRLVARSRAVSRDQVAHGVVANVGKAHAAQARLDRRGDERLEQRLVLEQRGLWARYLDERDQEVLRLLAGDARL